MQYLGSNKVLARTLFVVFIAHKDLPDAHSPDSKAIYQFFVLPRHYIENTSNYITIEKKSENFESEKRGALNSSHYTTVESHIQEMGDLLTDTRLPKGFQAKNRENFLLVDDRRLILEMDDLPHP